MTIQSNLMWPVGSPPAPSFTHEQQRLQVLESYVLDSLVDDPELRTITEFAARLCDAPVALISLVEEERQLFLAREGLDARETPRDVSFCAHAMLHDSVMLVPDATQDDRFADNPLVTGAPHIRFYAGQPLISQEGAPLGTLCVIDSHPRPQGLTSLQRQGLVVLGQSVMRRLRSRRGQIESIRRLQRSEEQLRALADSMPDIAWSADANGKLDYFNSRWFEYTGVKDAEYKRDLVHPEDYERASAAWKQAVRDGTPYEAESRLRSANGEWRWMLVRAEPVMDDEGRAHRWFGTMTDVDEAHRLSETRELLARELSHRIKNIFAVVAGLISLAVRKKPEHREFAEELTGTIRALGRAHDYVRPSGGQRQGTLLGMLGDLFQPYADSSGPRVHVQGDDAPIAARAATPVALVFHELATNSAKYGALSNDTGVVELAIEDRGEMLKLRWVEQGGPPPGSEMNEGFGSRLVDMSVKGQLGGSWERRFTEEGLVVELKLSRQAISPDP
ncbi:conserved hypothetical protein [Altererythrobacter sp. B11]|uniref:sensor histidine kinase n=1 Tax=Altererythrobacter sp. B11 TaxID=2060312 RepID=UPI000DC6E216|nr:PAS domain-containing protein [Altererythrobacter sp. B11]BBC71155.1 conserved hypothetical protein [Altererythrobacter sp. B11]